jgi:serine/threonine protein kinase
MISRTIERVGKYELLEFLGREGSSRLFKVRSLAHYPVSDGEASFATLRIYKQIGVTSEIRPLFSEQAGRLAQHAHMSLPRCMDAFHWPTPPHLLHPCLVMEWTEGDRLLDILSAGRSIGRADVARWFGQMAEGYCFARQAGLSIRPLHPAHVLVDADGSVKLLGLGLPCLEEPRGATLSGSARFFDYVAPEYAGNDACDDEPSSIFTFGVCLYQALTGSLPFPPLEDRTGDGDCFGSVVASYLGRWQNPGALQPDFDTPALRDVPAIRKLLAQCLPPDREKRLSRFEDLRTRFESARSELEGRTIPAARPAPRLAPTPEPDAAKETPAPAFRWRWLGWAATLSGILGLALFTGRILSPEDSRNIPVHDAPPDSAPAEASIRLAYREDLAAEMRPPVQLWFKTVDSGWAPADDHARVPPGTVDLRFERADYLPISRSVPVPGGVKSFLVNLPASSDWAPAEALRDLRETEAEWEHKAMSALAARFAQPNAPALEWPAHRQRFEAVWTAWLAEAPVLYETVVLRVAREPDPPGEPPVEMRIRQAGGSRWLAISGPVRLRRGNYEISFQRPDYEPVLRPVALTGQLERQHLAGPRPEDWRPAPRLQALLEMERAWADGNLELLNDGLAQLSISEFESPRNAERLSQLREHWFKKILDHHTAR